MLKLCVHGDAACSIVMCSQLPCPLAGGLRRWEFAVRSNRSRLDRYHRDYVGRGRGVPAGYYGSANVVRNIFNSRLSLK